MPPFCGAKPVYAAKKIQNTVASSADAEVEGAMCGIAGIIDLTQQRTVPQELVRAMARAIVHRGPDEEGFHFRPGLALASRRLSIVGLADGQQPMTNEDRNVVVVFNGELFDHLEKRAELRLAADDVFVNVAGGVKVAEPAIDLAIALAIASAHTNRALPQGTFALGELGLGGEIRSIPQLEVRLKEAARLGLGHAIVPHMGGRVPKLGGMALHEVRRLSQALADI